MNPDIIAAALSSARDSHAALVTLAKNSTGPAADAAWHDAGKAHRIAANLCVLLATSSIERSNP